MDENLSRGYIQLGKSGAVNDYRFGNGLGHLSPPVDKYNGVYYALIMAGTGFLLPYNRLSSLLLARADSLDTVENVHKH